MNSRNQIHTATAPSSLPFWRSHILQLAAFAVILLSGGCATTSQVKGIVAESNAALLAAQLEISLQPDGSGPSGGDWKRAAEKIEVFIAENPGQHAAIGALRVRQAILYLSHRQFNLAQAAFDAASHLRTDRDKSLKALGPYLVWWYQNSAAPAWDENDQARAAQALRAFDTQIAGLQESPDIRDFLAEMRARMGLKLAGEQQGRESRDTLVETLNRYSTIFTQADIQALRRDEVKLDSPHVTTVERRRLRALAVLNRARRIVDEAELTSLSSSDLENPEFGRLVFDA